MGFNYLVERSEIPKAFVVLFPGGNGKLIFDKQDGGKRYSNNFLVRNRKTFAIEFDVLVVGPHDSEPKGYTTDKRTSKIHEIEVKRLVKRINTKNLPVFLIGTSRGTLSVHSMAQMGSWFKGVVHTSTLTGDPAFGEIRSSGKPFKKLVVHHKKDGCWITPFKGARQFAKRIKATFMAFSGGERGEKGHECKGLSYHGFWGKDPEVVEAISKWILKHLRKG